MMRRFLSRGRRTAGTVAARGVFRPIDRASLLGGMLGGLLALGLSPAQAQTAFGTLPDSTVDPWSGIMITVSPSSAYDSAGATQTQGALDEEGTAESTAPHTGDAPSAPVTAPTVQSVAGVAAPETETASPSLWEALSLAIGGDTPDLPAQEPAPNQLIARPTRVATPARPTVPTNLEVQQGPASLAVSTNASGSAARSGFSGATAGGASAEVKARLGVEQDNLSVYSTGVIGASASTSTPSLYDNLAVGSTYSVPLAPLGLGQEKLGASVEVNNSQTLTTGVELRAPLGTYERFISVERTATPESSGSGIVKAGVLGKF